MPLTVLSQAHQKRKRRITQRHLPNAGHTELPPQSTQQNWEKCTCNNRKYTSQNTQCTVSCLSCWRKPYSCTQICKCRSCIGTGSLGDAACFSSTRSCSNNACVSQRAQWGEWEEWSQCSSECTSGTRSRYMQHLISLPLVLTFNGFTESTPGIHYF